MVLRSIDHITNGSLGTLANMNLVLASNSICLTTNVVVFIVTQTVICLFSSARDSTFVKTFVLSPLSRSLVV